MTIRLQQLQDHVFQVVGCARVYGAHHEPGAHPTTVLVAMHDGVSHKITRQLLVITTASSI